MMVKLPKVQNLRQRISVSGHVIDHTLNGAVSRGFGIISKALKCWINRNYKTSVINTTLV